MISDGILPSNEGRGYVLRRIIRRAARHGRLLGIDGKFLANLSTDSNRRQSKDGYPELEEKKDFILKVLTQEEDKFNKTIDQGLAILDGSGRRDDGRRKDCNGRRGCVHACTIPTASPST